MTLLIVNSSRITKLLNINTLGNLYLNIKVVVNPDITD